MYLAQAAGYQSDSGANANSVCGKTCLVNIDQQRKHTASDCSFCKGAQFDSSTGHYINDIKKASVKIACNAKAQAEENMNHIEVQFFLSGVLLVYRQNKIILTYRPDVAEAVGARSRHGNTSNRQQLARYGVSRAPNANKTGPRSNTRRHVVGGLEDERQRAYEKGGWKTRELENDNTLPYYLSEASFYFTAPHVVGPLIDMPACLPI